MLPSVPKSFGRLSDAYRSAFLALQGSVSPLGLPIRKSYAVILIDGLGSSNIKSAGAHASFLNKKIQSSKTLFSGFPSTTASSLASFATGAPNGKHGFLGYRVYDRRITRAINLLNDLGDSLDPRKYQDLETVSEQAVAAGLEVVTLGPAEYSESGFTKATMPAAKYVAAKTIDDRFSETKRLIAKPGVLVYLYVPELDQLAHRFGTSSAKWLEAIEDLDGIVSRFAGSLPKGSGAILTADHGVIDVPKSAHLYLDEYESFADVEVIGGDPRVGFIYFPLGTDLVEKRSQIQAELEGIAEITTIEELVQSGWLSSLSQAANHLAPDLIVLPKGERVLYHRKFAKTKSLEMIGQHGGMLKEEWEVPLLVF